MSKPCSRCFALYVGGHLAGEMVQPLPQCPSIGLNREKTGRDDEKRQATTRRNRTMTTTEKKPAGYYRSRSDSRGVACVHRHRTEAAALKCAKRMRCPAHAVFVDAASARAAESP